MHVVPPNIFPEEDRYILAGVKDGNFSIIFHIEDDFPQVQLSNIRWHFTNLNHTTTEIEPSDHYEFSSDLIVLEIHNVQLADRGNYSLTAGNEAGVRSATIQMDVYGEYQSGMIQTINPLFPHMKSYCIYIYSHVCMCLNLHTYTHFYNCTSLLPFGQSIQPSSTVKELLLPVFKEMK